MFFESNALPLLGGRERIFTLHRIGGSMSPTEEGMKLGEKEDFDLVLQSGTSRNRRHRICRLGSGDITGDAPPPP